MSGRTMIPMAALAVFCCSRVRYFPRTQHKDRDNKDGKTIKEQQQDYVREYEAKLLTPKHKAH